MGPKVYCVFRQTFFRAKRAYYVDSCDNWWNIYPGQAVTEYHIAEIFIPVHEKTTTIKKAAREIQLTGICCLDENVCTQENCLP